MTAEDIRALHRIIDRRVEKALFEQGLELARGTVTEVGATTLAARLDDATIPTPGIAFMAGETPIAGDDIEVLRRRRDGLVLAIGILGR